MTAITFVAALPGTAYAVLGSTPAGAVTPTWITQASYPSATAVINGFSCVSAEVCIAVGASGYGAAILTSSDSGATWTNQIVPGPATELFGVSCASASDCVAVGDSVSEHGAAAIVATDDGGAAWFAEPVPSGLADVSSISCPSTSICVATAQSDANSPSILITANGGNSWNDIGLPTSDGQVDSVSCASVDTCVMVGGTSSAATVLTTSDGGATWTNQSAPAGMKGILLGVSCASVSHCVAVGGNTIIIATADAGSSWNSAPLPGDVGYLSSISCPSTSDCVAVGGASEASTSNGGLSWTGQTLPAGVEGTVVSCFSTSACLAAGHGTISPNLDILASGDGGSTWTSHLQPSGISKLTGISCSSTSDCVAVGYDGSNLPVALTTADGGVTWTNQSVPALGMDFLRLLGVSCPSVSVCVAVGEGNLGDVTFTSDDGGVSWSSHTVPSGVSMLTGVSCFSVTECLAVGADEASSPGTAVVLATTDGGSSWAQQTPRLNLPTTIPYAQFGISCPSATECVAVADDMALVLSTTDGGTTWTGQTEDTPGSILFGISCTSNSDCVGVGSTGLDTGLILTTSDGGVTWESRTVPVAAHVVAAVSCTSDDTCVAVGQVSDSPPSGSVLLSSVDGGGSWTSQVVPSGSNGLLDVDCPSSTACEVVGLRAQGGVVILGQSILPIPTTSASVQPATATYGQTVIYSVGISGSAGTAEGSVTFSVDSTALCTATLSAGSGHCVATNAPTGDDVVTATYSGDASYRGSVDTTSLTIGRAATTTSPVAAPNPVTIGHPVRYWATLRSTGGSFSGTVTFSVGSTTLCRATVSGRTVGCLADNAPLGADRVLAIYSGDANHEGSTGHCGLVVELPPPLSITTASLPVALRGVGYSAALSVIGGTAPYEWTVSSGSLPTGLSLDLSSGVISGVPSSIGVSSFRVEVVDTRSVSASAVLSISVAKACPRARLPGSSRPPLVMVGAIGWPMHPVGCLSWRRTSPPSARWPASLSMSP